ncbi:MAG: hypothetical protein Q4B22_00415 [Eubacteriales bacterium]|nr:hypothetical protein [Eubacteriales bacterium]
MQELKKTGRVIGLFIFIFLAGGMVAHLGARYGFYLASTPLYLAVLVVMIYHFAESIADQGMLRRLLLLIGWCLLFHIFLRGLKYHAFFEYDTLRRYIWYMYYIPICLVPPTGFLAVLLMDEPIGKPKKKRFIVMYLIAAVLMLIVMTNDLHQLVFRFYAGIEKWNTTYGYGIGFAAVSVWQYGLYSATLVLLVRKCTLASVKRLWWLPLIPFIIGMPVIIFCVFLRNNHFGIISLSFSEIYCWMLAFFWECCLCTGLVPTNHMHGKLMNISSMDAQIADQTGRVIYRSQGAADLTEEQITTPGNSMLGEDTILHCIKIPGGYGCWQEDISEINENSRKLEEIRGVLEEESEVLRLENEWKENQTATLERSRLYDTIASDTSVQSALITRLAEEAEKNPALYEKNARTICFLGAYIKRYANLTLIGAKDGCVHAAEMGMAIGESLRYMKNLQIQVDSMLRSDAILKTETALLAYKIVNSFFYRNLEWMTGVYVSLLGDAEAVLKLTLEGASEAVCRDVIEQYRTDELPVTMLAEDEILYIRLFMNGTEARPEEEENAIQPYSVHADPERTVSGKEGGAEV